MLRNDRIATKDRVSRSALIFEIWFGKIAVLAGLVFAVAVYVLVDAVLP